MIEHVKSLILEKYLEFRFRKIKNSDELYDFPKMIQNVTHIFVILSAERDLEKENQEFLSSLYKIFSEARISTFERSSLRKEDMNRLGVPNDQYLKNIQDEKFDLVIDLNVKQDKICSYLTALSGASMRLNLTSGRYDHIYNLHIRGGRENTPTRQFGNILTYLKSLRQK
ncbi:MAG: hypothetical protein AB7W47_01465 [Calditrichaceae bacterium]